MPRTRLRTILSVAMATAMASILSTGGVVTAVHSTPLPIEYWDSNDNWVPDDAIVLVDARGTGWTQTKLDRLNAAVDEWKNNTDFDPGRTVTGNYTYYVDGTIPPCTGGFGSGDIAFTCAAKQPRVEGCCIDHYRIIDKDTYHNLFGFSWWYGSTHTGAENVLDFQGVITHEIGHWIRLVHVPGACSSGTAIETMCASPPDLDDDTWRFRSLEPDDENGADYVYP